MFEDEMQERLLPLPLLLGVFLIGHVHQGRHFLHLAGAGIVVVCVESMDQMMVPSGRI